MSAAISVMVCTVGGRRREMVMCPEVRVRVCYRWGERSFVLQLA